MNGVLAYNSTCSKILQISVRSLIYYANIYGASSQAGMCWLSATERWTRQGLKTLVAHWGLKWNHQQRRVVSVASAHAQAVRSEQTREGKEAGAVQEGLWEKTESVTQEPGEGILDLRISVYEDLGRTLHARLQDQPLAGPGLHCGR